MATACVKCGCRVPINGWCAKCRINNDEKLLSDLQDRADNKEVPHGSAAYACPRCLTVSVSAGDGCNNCGFGYCDDEDCPTDKDKVPGGVYEVDPDWKKNRTK
jgi:hypothetical protein